MTFAFDAAPFGLLDPGIEHSVAPHASIEARGVAQVESESSQRRSKFSGNESKADSIESAAIYARSDRAAADDARPIVEEWVDTQMPLCGHKRMVAYGVVARMFKCHESLIRRLLGRQVTRLDADFYKRVMLSEADLRDQQAARARLDLARCKAQRDRTGVSLDEEAPDASH